MLTRQSPRRSTNFVGTDCDFAPDRLCRYVCSRCSAQPKRSADSAIATNELGRVADHVLVDEGQDLQPAHWMLIRALVGEGPNDIFIAEDAHQRIYGQRLVLSRFGIKTQGRSRKLTLNDPC